MADITFKQFAESIGTDVNTLFVQFKKAGMSIQAEDPDQIILPDQKLELLNYLQRSHGAAAPLSAPKKITLKRKKYQ